MEKIEKIKKEIKLKLSQYEKKYEELTRYEVHLTAKEIIDQRIKELKEVLSIFDTIEDDPVSDDLEEAIGQSFTYHENHGDDFRSDKQIETAYRYGFETGAKWQKQQDQETIELAEDHAMLAGMEKMKEQMTKDVIDGLYIKRNKYTKKNVVSDIDRTHDVFQKFKDGDRIKMLILKDE